MFGRPSAVWSDAAVAVEQRHQEHVRVELVRHAEPDRVSDLLELRRRLADVVPGVGRDTDVEPEALPVLDRVGDVVVREAEVPLRLRVVRRLVGDVRHLPELLRHLLDQVVHRHHLLLQRRRREEELDEVVPASGRHLRGGRRRQQSVVDVVDVDLHVVLLAPRLDVGVVEPRVVRRHEVRPLEDLQVPLELLVLVLERAGEAVRALGQPAEHADRERAGGASLDQLLPGQA